MQISVSTLLSHKDANSIHPAVLQLGLRYADGTIKGASARCMAMLSTFCQVRGPSHSFIPRLCVCKAIQDRNPYGLNYRRAGPKHQPALSLMHDYGHHPVYHRLIHTILHQHTLKVVQD